MGAARAALMPEPRRAWPRSGFDSLRFLYWSLSQRSTTASKLAAKSMKMCALIAVLAGVVIMSSPTGRIPRSHVDLGNYKYPIGFGLIVIGMVMFKKDGEKK